MQRGIKNGLISSRGYSVHFLIVDLDLYNLPVQRINKALKWVPVRFLIRNQSDFFHIHNYFFSFFCGYGGGDVFLPFYLQLKDVRVFHDIHVHVFHFHAHSLAFCNSNNSNNNAFLFLILLILHDFYMT